MNVAIGTDIIEINRIKEAIENRKNFLNKIYSNNEIKYCESKKNQKYESYAVRFAAKEAIYKALSDRIDDFNWTDFEVLNDETGKPYINLNIKINSLDKNSISLSHCKDYATAYVLFTFK